jgi:hypothetical protein
MNMPQAKEIQYATKIYDNTLPIASIVQNNIINQDNLMHINIHNVNETELKNMIEYAQILQEKIRNALNMSFIMRHLTNIDVLVKEQKIKLKKINILCNELAIIEVPYSWLN